MRPILTVFASLFFLSATAHAGVSEVYLMMDETATAHQVMLVDEIEIASGATRSSAVTASVNQHVAQAMKSGAGKFDRVFLKVVNSSSGRTVIRVFRPIGAALSSPIVLAIGGGLMIADFVCNGPAFITGGIVKSCAEAGSDWADMKIAVDALKNPDVPIEDAAAWADMDVESAARYRQRHLNPQHSPTYRPAILKNDRTR